MSETVLLKFAEFQKLKKQVKTLKALQNRMIAVLKRCIDMDDVDFEGTIAEIHSIISEVEKLQTGGEL